MNPTVPTIITGLIVGALVAVGTVGTRGFHFLPAFIVISGFVIAVGLLVNMACAKIAQHKRSDRISNRDTA
jgi:hypothetical protein